MCSTSVFTVMTDDVDVCDVFSQYLAKYHYFTHLYDETEI